MATDAELLRAWSEGDEAAGNQLVRRHFATVARFFRSKVDSAATDLIQRTFLGCLRARERVDRIVSFRAYVLGIARHVLLEYLRQTHREAHRLELLELLELSVHDLGVTPSEAAAMREEQRLLLTALQRLPLEIQMAVELFYWEQLPEKEIAEVLDIPQGTVKSRLSRGRELLRKHLGDLAATPAQLESTMKGLEGWARAVQRGIGKIPRAPT